GNQLDRDPPSQGHVLRLAHRSHAASAKWTEQPVLIDRRRDRRTRRSFARQEVMVAWTGLLECHQLLSRRKLAVSDLAHDLLLASFGNSSAKLEVFWPIFAAVGINSVRELAGRKGSAELR